LETCKVKTIEEALKQNKEITAVNPPHPHTTNHIDQKLQSLNR